MNSECEHLEPQLSAWLDEELETSSVSTVSTHLEECERCRETVAQFKALGLVAAGLEVPQVTDAEWEESWERVSVLLGGAAESEEECSELAPLLSAYLDEELDETDVALVAVHLEVCDACRAVVEQHRALDAAAAADDVPPVSDEEWAERWQPIAEAVRREVSDSTKVTPFPTRVLWAGAAAAGVILTFLLTYFWSQPPPERPRSWRTRHEFSVEEINARDAGIVPVCYYSPEAEATIVWLPEDDSE